MKKNSHVLIVILLTFSCTSGTYMKVSPAQNYLSAQDEWQKTLSKNKSRNKSFVRSCDKYGYDCSYKITFWYSEDIEILIKKERNIKTYRLLVDEIWTQDDAEPDDRGSTELTMEVFQGERPIIKECYDWLNGSGIIYADAQKINMKYDTSKDCILYEIKSHSIYIKIYKSRT
jgi:hypothetical protein